MRDEPEELLFHKHDLRAVIEHCKAKLKEEVDGFARDYILNVSVDDLCDYLENKFTLSPIALHKDKIYVKEHGEAKEPAIKALNNMLPFVSQGCLHSYTKAFQEGRTATYAGSLAIFPIPRVAGHIIKTEDDLKIAEALANVFPLD